MVGSFGLIFIATLTKFFFIFGHAVEDSTLLGSLRVDFKHKSFLSCTLIEQGIYIIFMVRFFIRNNLINASFKEVERLN